MFNTKKKEAAKKIILWMNASISQLVQTVGTTRVQVQDSFVQMNRLDYFLMAYMKYNKGQGVIFLADWVALMSSPAAKSSDPIKFVTEYFKNYRGWLHDMRNAVAKGRKEAPAAVAAIFGDQSNCKACSAPEMDCADCACRMCRSANLLNALIGAEIQVCQMDQNYEICRMEKYSEPKTSILNSEPHQRKKIEGGLNNLWQQKCSIQGDAEWVDSMFCALGKGNLLANFVMRMRFRVPENANQNILMSIHKIINQVPKPLDAVVEGVFNNILKKIKNRELLSWADLSTLVRGIIAMKTTRNLIESYSQPYGLSTLPVAAEQETRQTIASSSVRVIDLDRMWDAYCKSDPNQAPGEWIGSLFCELGFDNAAAKLIGKIRFVIPPNDPNNHAVLVLLKIIENGLKAPDPLTGEQTWTKWGIEKGLMWAVSGIITKIQNRQQLHWEDLDAVFQLTTTNFTHIPLIGSKIANLLGGETLGPAVENATNDALNPIGIGFAPPMPIYQSEART